MVCAVLLCAVCCCCVPVDFAKLVSGISGGWRLAEGEHAERRLAVAGFGAV